MGNLLSVAVHAANIHDTIFGLVPAMLAFEKYPTIAKFCADMGYRGTFVEEVLELLGLDVDISEKIKPGEWEKLPWRWIVGLQAFHASGWGHELHRAWFRILIARPRGAVELYLESNNTRQ